MSVNAMAKIWGANLNPTQKLILLSMADHADHDGERIYPSIGLLAWKTGISVRQIRRVISFLEKKDIGILERTGIRKNRVVEYRIVFSKIPYLSSYEGINHLHQDEEPSHTPNSLEFQHDPNCAIKESHLKKGCDTMTQLDESCDSIESQLNPSYDTMTQHKNKKSNSGYDFKESQPKKQVVSFETSSCDSIMTHKPLIKQPFKNVVVDSTTTNNNNFESLSKNLIHLGISYPKVKQLTGTIQPDIILAWANLFPLAKENGFASKPDWIYTACWYGWDIQIIKNWIADPPEQFDDDILGDLDHIGWIGPKDELFYYFQAEPERFENWLKFLLREVDNGNDRIKNPGGILRENLRNGTPAPRIVKHEENSRKYIEGNFAEFIEH